MVQSPLSVPPASRDDALAPRLPANPEKSQPALVSRAGGPTGDAHMPPFRKGRGERRPTQLPSPARAFPLLPESPAPLASTKRAPRRFIMRREGTRARFPPTREARGAGGDECCSPNHQYVPLHARRQVWPMTATSLTAHSPVVVVGQRNCTFHRQIATSCWPAATTSRSPVPASAAPARSPWWVAPTGGRASDRRPPW